MIEYVSDLLEEYKLSSDSQHKQELLEKFKFELWNSKYKNYKYKKRIHYQVKPELLANEQLIDLFNKYNDIKYSVERSYYKDRNKISSIDYIRIHINNLYSKLFDNDTYLPKKYYENLFTTKNLYFKVIKLSKQEQNELDIELLEKQIKESIKNAKDIKEQYIKDQKCILSFKEYKKLINSYIDSLFENYKIFDDYKDSNGWDYSKIATTIVFGEENYTISYFNKSISGYLRNYFRKDKGIKRVLDGKGNVVGMFKVDGVFEEFTILQIGISRFYENKEELIKIDDKFFRQLTPNQKELIGKLKNITEIDDILFYENGLPYFKWLNLADKLDLPEYIIRFAFQNINNRIVNIKNNKNYKYCECCGIKFKKVPKSKSVNCNQCREDIRREKVKHNVFKFRKSEIGCNHILKRLNT